MQKKHQHIVPMFPLNSIVLPGEELPLYIFEPRYKQLLTEVIEHKTVFGIPFVRYGRVSKYGTMVMLKKVYDIKDTGEMNVLVEGLNTFKIASFFNEFPGRLYPGGELVQNFPDESIAEPKDLEKTQLELINFQQKLNKNLEKNSHVNMKSSFEFAKLLDISVEHKYNLIIKPTEEERLRYIREYLVLNAAIIAQEENLQNRFIMN